MPAPENLKYTEDHEWVRIDGTVATVGITDFAQKQLGDIVFVEVTTVGKKVTAREPVGTIESVKAVAEVFAPVPGVIAEHNSELDGEPELINTDPYGEGWVVKIQLDKGADLSGLLDKEPEADS